MIKIQTIIIMIIKADINHLIPSFLPPDKTDKYRMATLIVLIDKQVNTQTILHNSSKGVVLTMIN